jgi:hypothetical protein
MKTSITLIVIFLVLSANVLSGQDKTGKDFPAQLSLVFPVGTHGHKSTDFCYNFSLNALMGYTGGVRGVELGGLINLNKGNISGFQAGGIGNSTKGNVRGMQAGGIFNISGNMNGFQVSGIIGKAGAVKGLQVSGIVSVAESSDAQISGIANINPGKLNGIQIGGIYNQTRELRGMQIGLINVSDTNSGGIAVGLISIAKKSIYQELSVSVADYMNVGITYKMGVKHFYNIYSLGINFMEDQLWVAGLGFGNITEINDKYSFQPEIVCYTYLPLDFYEVRDTYVTHIKFGFVREINKMFAITFAPSIYGALKSDRGEYDTYGYDQSPINPIYEFTGRNSNSKFELGFGLSLGLNIR